MCLVGAGQFRDQIAIGKRLPTQLRTILADRAQPVVVVVEQRQIQAQAPRGRGAEAQFIGRQQFGIEITGPADLRHDRKGCERRWERLHVDQPDVGATLHPRRGAHGVRNRAPETGLLGRFPQQAKVGLDFESGVVVVFKLGSQDETQTVPDQFNVILDSNYSAYQRKGNDIVKQRVTLF